MELLTHPAGKATSLLVVLSLLVVVTGCSDKKTTSSPPSTTAPKVLNKGVGFTPKSFAAADFNQFFTLAGQAGSGVMWAGDWMQLEPGSGAPAVLAQTAQTYGCTPIFAVQFFEPSSGALLRPLDAANRQTYRTKAESFVEKYRPAYLGIGVEVNILYEKSLSDFEAFVQFYDEVYLSLKNISPTTKVFTIFQLEKMKGLRGGLFGGTNDAAKNEWALLDRFTNSDLAAFTTYPGLIYKAPAEIPADYYTEIAKHTAKPIAFTEIGWHGAASPQGWESSEDEQASFVRSFFSMTQTINPVFRIWSFLYDQNTVEPFNSMGFMRQDGSLRPAFNEWTAGS